MRGLAREQGHWGPFVAHLRAAFPGDQITAVDLPGSGARHAAGSPASVAGLLAAVRGDGLPAAVWLIGLSLGGMVAHEWLRRYPDEVAGAVLINTSFGGLSRPWQRMRPAAAAAVLRALLTRDDPARERGIFALTSARPDLQQVAVADWVALARRHPVRRMNVARQLWAAARHRAAPLAPGAPLLLLASRGDRLVDPSCSRALAAAAGVPLREHPTAGHDLPLDDPTWVTAEVAAWLPLLSGPPTRA
jgi:pimeloyl-ACP methyl ester carboxylesterase